ncbi:mammalian cell entry protein [Mycobacterium asiaticum]|uniref:mammalian cell entry protein n=1 Tax=Mycobacterium asiaticum TaxID=1790 RepID=UPI0007EFC76A|nr:mammalian cell entry protein [Mycobacterium asiaticum]OBI92047.1 mammalian cell entry protein [Mycobacterium asiaticum]
MAEQQSTTQRVRRRASRAAGPPKAVADAADLSEASASPETTVTVEAKADTTADTESASKGKGKGKGKSNTRAKAKAKAKAAAKKAGKSPTTLRPPPRRRAHAALVGWVSLAAAVLTIAGLAWGVTVLVLQHRDAQARQAREQRFVDTARQTVVNMFSYTPETIDEAVNRFVNGTSGPLRGMLSANNNVDNLKGLFRSTNATSEAVINGAALEGIDTVSDNASVLVAVRVTVADIDGVNKPSMPYRLRVIVHEDESGRMTGYDLKYPDGGN